MITGIFKLNFASGVEFIDGALDVEKQWDWIESNILANKASAKLMAAYKKHGLPNKEILFECHKDHLDFMTKYFIDRERPALNSGKIENPLSEEDFKIIKRNINLMSLSTMEHISIIDKLEEILESYENKDDDTEAIRKRLMEKETEVDKILRLPWYKRIFL